MVKRVDWRSFVATWLDPKMFLTVDERYIEGYTSKAMGFFKRNGSDVYEDREIGESRRINHIDYLEKKSER